MQIIILILCFFTGYISAQDKQHIQPEDRKEFIDAEYYYLYEDFQNALPIYLKLVKKYPENANLNYRIGMCLLRIPVDETDPKRRAVDYLIKATQNISDRYTEGSYKETAAPAEAYFYLGNAYRFNHMFNEAIAAYEKFKEYLSVDDAFYIDFVNREIQATRNAIELVQLPVEVETDNILTTLNAPAIMQNCPVISDDENVLVFTAGRNNNFSPDIALDLINQDYEMDKIYFCKKVDTAWTKPRNIMEELGAKGTKIVPVTISGDGKTLYLVRDDNDNGNIYYSKYVDDHWTPIKKLNKNINTKYWESHATIVPDGSVLYFTSDRPGGFGGLDIYKSVKDESGDWGPAVNLGSTVNSIYDEETPFILDDGRTLYFSSQGHYSMGGFDVFHTRLLDNGKWSTPLNLGYPINTVGNDLFYLPKANGEYAFFPLNNNERGFGNNNTIMRISVVTPETQKPEINLKGIISLQDKKNVLPPNTSMYVYDNTKHDTILVIPADRNTGEYFTPIDPGDYVLTYRAKGYKEHEENLFIPEIFTKKDIVINVELVPLQVSSGEYFVIRSIFFDYGKYDLRKESKIELEKLGKLMLDHPSLYVEVIGHTDAISSAEFNKKLSEKRARAAIDYLVNMGISVDRFVSKGMGEEQHIAINQNPDGSDNPEGRQLNRRVEIKIIKSDESVNIVREEIYVPPALRYKKQKLTYTILLTQSPKPLPKTYFLSNNPDGIFDNVEAINGEDGILYILGSFNQKSEALNLLNQVIDLGFEDAEIIDNEKLEDLKAKDLTVDILNSINTTTDNQSNIEEIEQQHEGDVFTIQLKALLKPVDVKVFSNLKDVKMHLCPDGFYRYTYGKYKDYQSAFEAKKSVIELGYPDAFIVKADQFNKLENIKGEFTIQIASTRKPSPMRNFANLDGVQEHIGNDGAYKYTIGKFNSYDEAKRELKKIIKKGYPDAFVVNVEKYTK
ncbi:MAG: hypothetical protein Kow0068_15360 [Marinilabiliales bacterium]